jgi:hypothetical protein
MKSEILIIECKEAKIREDFSNMSVVHCRNSFIIASYLGADLISHETEIENTLKKSYSHIVCCYASGYMMYKKYFKILEKNKNADIFWLVNDHKVHDSPLLRMWIEKYQIKYDMISNNNRNAYDLGVLNYILSGKKINEWIENWYVLNLNCLIFDISTKRRVKKNLFQESKEDCIYYGTYRQDRILDMLDYNSFDYCISTSKKNVSKYKQSGVLARYIKKLDWQIGNETLYNFKYSIYFEDSHTHTNYAFMGNRYYECIMLDVLVFFDYRCRQTIEKSGYRISEFCIVKNGEDLRNKISLLESNRLEYEQLINLQRSNYELILKEKEFVLRSLKNIFEIKKERTQIKDYDFLIKRKVLRSNANTKQLSIFD